MGDQFEPKFLFCCDCREEFCFTADAQEYWAERGYHHDPKRCKACHASFRKAKRKDGSGSVGQTIIRRPLPDTPSPPIQ